MHHGTRTLVRSLGAQQLADQLASPQSLALFSVRRFLRKAPAVTQGIVIAPVVILTCRGVPRPSTVIPSIRSLASNRPSQRPIK